MPEKSYDFFINKSVRCVVRFITENGKVIGFVVRMQAFIDGKWRDIRRYDTAHGTPHIDVLNWRGKTIEKIWMPQLPPGDAMTFAISDIKNNSKTYIRRFEK